MKLEIFKIVSLLHSYKYIIEILSVVCRIVNLHVLREKVYISHRDRQERKDKKPKKCLIDDLIIKERTEENKKKNIVK